MNDRARYERARLDALAALLYAEERLRTTSLSSAERQRILEARDGVIARADRVER